MAKYNVENNIDFHEELYKMLDYDSDCDNKNDDLNLCKISGEPLSQHSVLLECSHMFNYNALFKEICKQKYVFKTYDYLSLSKSERNKFKQKGYDYFIKCPYCRNMQYDILPYIKELNLPFKYGVNTLDKSLDDNLVLINPLFPSKKIDESYSPFFDKNSTYSFYKHVFKYGNCCKVVGEDGELCKSKLVDFIKDTDLSYCTEHYFEELHKYKCQPKSGTAIPPKSGTANEAKLCIAIIKSGPRKGHNCNCKVASNNDEFCGKHLKTK